MDLGYGKHNNEFYSMKKHFGIIIYITIKTESEIYTIKNH
jgi:hypothetical protein